MGTRTPSEEHGACFLLIQAGKAAPRNGLEALQLQAWTAGGSLPPTEGLALLGSWAAHLGFQAEPGARDEGSSVLGPPWWGSGSQDARVRVTTARLWGVRYWNPSRSPG